MKWIVKLVPSEDDVKAGRIVKQYLDQGYIGTRYFADSSNSTLRYITFEKESRVEDSSQV